MAASAPAKENVSTYYDRPVLKPPVWNIGVPVYLFAGGLGGASSVLALLARLSGRERLARRALITASAAAVASPVLLIQDLGRPDRFYNMLRVFRPTSPMSVGSWILSLWGGASTAATLSDSLRWLRPLRLPAAAGAGVLGLGMSTYTGALLAQTSIPAWHRARRWLPFLFAAGAASSAGAAGVLFVPSEEAGPARRLAMIGAVSELAAEQLVKASAGDHGAAYDSGRARAFGLAGRVLTLAGASALAFSGRRRAGALAGGLAVLAGSLGMRLAVFEAGFDSARRT